MTTLAIGLANSIAGTLGYPSKMPGTSYGLSAYKCKVGSKLAKVPGSVCDGCYAMKGHYIYDNVAAAHAKRLAGISKAGWVDALVSMLIETHIRGRGTKGRIASGWHRWHDSGDIQSVAHLGKICQVASKTPHIRHWLPTRELAMVQAYVKSGGIVPDNLLIRVSGTMIDGPATKAWPFTSVVNANKPVPDGAHKCPAPTQGNACGECRACWSRDVAQVSYHKH